MFLLNLLQNLLVLQLNKNPIKYIFKREETHTATLHARLSESCCFVHIHMTMSTRTQLTVGVLPNPVTLILTTYFLKTFLSSVSFDRLALTTPIFIFLLFSCGRSTSHQIYPLRCRSAHHRTAGHRHRVVRRSATPELTHLA